MVTAIETVEKLYNNEWEQLYTHIKENADSPLDLDLDPWVQRFAQFIISQ